MHDPETSTQPLEGELRNALAWVPSPAVAAAMRARVGRAVDAAEPHHRRWPLRRPMVLGLAAAFILGGAAVGVGTLLQQAADFVPGQALAYERSEPLALSETHAGYTVTLERGYVDPNQLVLAFTVHGPEGQTVAVPRATVVDEQGRHYLETSGGDMTTRTPNAAGSIESYIVPPGIGATTKLIVTIDELQPFDEVAAPAGPWIFRFELPVHAVTVVEPDQRILAAGVPITLRRVQITATTVRVQLDANVGALLDEQWIGWHMDATLRQDGGPAEALDWSAFPPTWTGQPKDELAPILDQMEQGWVVVRQTFAGTDEPSGHWVLKIARLNGYDGQGHTRAIEGPWQIEFDVP